ncbi:MAG: M1 family metallopeptidase [Halieaceae bacterium]|nr:M1 family metallopeptidase [Halieaceae bacterium]
MISPRPFRRTIFLVIASIGLLLAACQSPTPTIAPAPTSDSPQPFDVAWDDRSLFSEGLISSEQGVLAELHEATVYHIDINIADDLLSLEGRQELRYTNAEEEPLVELYFRIFPNLMGGAVTVAGVRVDGQEVTPSLESADSALRVPLPSALEPGESVEVSLDFAVAMPQEMAGNYGLFGYFEDVLVLDEFYPVIPVYDDEGWNVEIPSRNGDVTYLDASFYQVRVTAPANLTVVASGTEVGSEYNGEQQTLTFAAGPARTFYLAASDGFTEVSEQIGETTIKSYAFSDRREGAELAAGVTANALRSFNQRFGVYPYTEFDVVSTPMTALGIEYPGMTGIALKLYDAEAEVLGLPSQVILESTVAHEVAHQWFYNVVGNDQVDDPWLDEAVVQYATGLYYRDTYDESAERRYRSSWDERWGRVDHAGIPIGLPTGAYEGSEYGAIVYGRGPIFVATLAEEMGEETFDAFLRDYYQSHQWGIGANDTFQRLAEEHCQCNLGELFVDWVYGE